MSSRKASNITVSDLPGGELAALRQLSERLGVTPETYVRTLIINALELDKLASHMNFAELSIPFQKALAGISEEELDATSRLF